MAITENEETHELAQHVVSEFNRMLGEAQEAFPADEFKFICGAVGDIAYGYQLNAPEDN